VLFIDTNMKIVVSTLLIIIIEISGIEKKTYKLIIAHNKNNFTYSGAKL